MTVQTEETQMIHLWSVWFGNQPILDGVMHHESIFKCSGITLFRVLVLIISL
jgi:hypothetical protein